MLDRSLRIAWGILAVPALGVLAFPQLVILGFFLFILPGIILACMPTLFAYLTAMLVVRLALPIRSALLANLASFCLVLLVGWVVMQPFRAKEVARYEAALLPEIVPPAPLRLQGNVRLEIIGSRGRPAAEPACDHLCIALLDVPGVTSVTRILGEQGATYALLPAAASPEAGLFPLDPGKIQAMLPGGANYQQRQQASKAIEAHWALRLATHQRLVSRPTLPATEADWVLRLVSQQQRGQPEIRRVEIVDSTGTCRFRKSHVRHTIPAYTFYFGFEGGSAASGFQGAHFHPGRKRLQSDDPFPTSDTEPTLLQATTVRVPEIGNEILEQLRAEVTRALVDPYASLARLELANRWLALFRYDANDADSALIARIVADPRIRDVAAHLEDVFRKANTPPALRDAYAERIVMEHTTAKDRLFLAQRLAAMPPGTFAQPSKAHLAIWTDPDLRHQAAPFVARLADLGAPSATTQLLAALEAAVPLSPWNAKRALVEGIRDGFATLGPDAAPAVPRIRELFLQRPSPILHNANDADQWRLTLLHMGVGMDDLPFYPNQDAQMVRRIKDRLRQQLQRDQSPSK